MTHPELVKLAIRWLHGTRRCSVVLSELVTSANCIPDAIGWRYGCHTTLVECKASKADFRADADKPSHRAGMILGAERYYLAPAGILAADDVPSPWGLLIASDGQIRTMKKPAEGDQRSMEACLEEMRLLVSALRRIKTREFISLVVAGDSEKETPNG